MSNTNYLEGFQNIVLVPSLGSSALDSFLTDFSESLHIATDLAQAEFIAISLTNPLLIIEVSNDTDIKKELLKQVASKINLLSHPLLLVGEYPLEDEARSLKIIGKKCRVLEINEDKVDSKIHLSTLEMGEVLQKEKNAFTSKDFSDIKGYLFHTRSYTSQAIFTGLTYSDLTIDSAVRNKSWLPTSSNYKVHIDFIHNNSTKWELANSYRNSFLVNQILRAVSFSPENLELAKATTFLFSYPNLIGFEELSRRRYIRRGQEKIKEELAIEVFKNSKILSENNRLTDVSEIVEKIARSIVEETTPDNSHASKIASAVQLADILGRETWHSSTSDSRSYYFLLRWLEDKINSSFEPDILSQIIQVIVSSNSKNTAVKSSKNVDNKTGSSLFVAELQSNSVVEKELLHQDGRVLIETNTRLDPDIIWRLWRLSTITSVDNVRIKT
jgi:hypothetical protein